MKKIVFGFLLLILLFPLGTPRAPSVQAQPAVGGSSDSPETLYMEALGYIGMQQFETAYSNLSRIVELGSTEPSLLRTMADICIAETTRLRNDGKDSELEIWSNRAAQISTLALAENPPDRLLLLSLVDLYRNLMDEKTAVSLLMTYQKNYPEDWIGNLQLAEYYFGKKRYELGIRYYQKVIDAHPNDTEDGLSALYQSYYRKGVYLNTIGEVNLALPYLEEAYTIYDRDPALAKQLFFATVMKLDTERAVFFYQQFPESQSSEELQDLYAGALFLSDSTNLTPFLAPREKESRYLKALAAYLRKDNTNSIKQLDGAVRSSRDRNYYYYYLYYLNYQALGETNRLDEIRLYLASYAKTVKNYPVARRWLLELSENPKTHPDIYWEIGSLEDEAGNIPAAISNYLLFSRDNQDSKTQIPALLRLSHLERQVSLTNDAETHLKAAQSLAENPGEIRQVYLYSAYLHIEDNQYSSAVTDLEKIIAEGKPDAQVYFLSATVQYELSNNTKAIQILENTISKGETSAEVYNLLAYLYSLEKKQLARALELIDQSLDLQPDNIAYIDTKAWILYQMGKPKEAKGWIDRVLPKIGALTSEEGADEMYYHAGKIYDALGEKESARRFYDKTLEANPNFKIER